MSETKGRVFQIRAGDEFFRQLDELRRIERDLPSRAEVLRRLVDEAYRKLEKKTAKR